MVGNNHHKHNFYFEPMPQRKYNKYVKLSYFKRYLTLHAGAW